MSESVDPCRAPIVGRRAVVGMLALLAPLVAGCGRRGPLSLPGTAADQAEEERRAREAVER